MTRYCLDRGKVEFHWLSASTWSFVCERARRHTRVMAGREGCRSCLLSMSILPNCSKTPGGGGREEVSASATAFWTEKYWEEGRCGRGDILRKRVAGRLPGHTSAPVRKRKPCELFRWGKSCPKAVSRRANQSPPWIVSLSQGLQPCPGSVSTVDMKVAFGSQSKPPSQSLSGHRVDCETLVMSEWSAKSKPQCCQKKRTESYWSSNSGVFVTASKCFPWLVNARLFGVEYVKTGLHMHHRYAQN